MNRMTLVTIVGVLAAIVLHHAEAAIVYSTIGSVYSENFDSLPTDTNNNGSIEGLYPDGWRDDVMTVPGTHVSVPGWHLFHPISPANENGFNGFQRFRMGSGQNTGAFWGFGSASFDTEKALGSIGSTTTAGNGANFYMALRLFNTTGFELNSFTLTFDGEQWRDGESPSAETMTFAYSSTATLTDWFSTAIFTSVPSFNFTSPVATDVNASGTPVDGNIAGLVPGITGTVNGISWAPGTEFWLRWADPQLAGFSDDGLAVDNVFFSAVPEPTSSAFLGIGAAALLSRRRRSLFRDYRVGPGEGLGV